jgi:hypothetical protein
LGAIQTSGFESLASVFDPLLTSPIRNILSWSESFPALVVGGHHV